MAYRDHGPGVFTIDGLLDDAECQALVADTEAIGYADAPITTAWGFAHMPEVRNNTRVMVDDHERARWLWSRVDAWIPARQARWRAVGLNERFRYYRYHPGQYFQWHHDGCYQRSLRERSTLTLIVYLNDDFEGGHTEFVHVGPIAPRRGMALVFEHGLRHRGAPVHEGTKYVMRTDVMYRRQLD